MRNSKSTRKGKASKKEVMALAAKDTRSYLATHKREPMKAHPKYINMGGVPHKMANGVLIPLTPKMA